MGVGAPGGGQEVKTLDCLSHGGAGRKEERGKEAFLTEQGPAFSRSRGQTTLLFRVNGWVSSMRAKTCLGWLFLA